MANYFDKLFEQGTKDGICMIMKCRIGYDLALELDQNEYFCYRLERPNKINSSIGGENWLCIKKSTIAKSKKITIYVPENYIAQIIGKSGNTIKQIARALGLQHIKVEAY